jgi:hypothetical protein
LQDAEPLLDLIDPRAMDGGEMELEARMFLKPSLSLFAVMDTDIVANDVNQSNLGWGGLIQVLKEGDEFLLPFTSEALACDMPGSCIEGGAKRLRAPSRRYSCSRRLGIFPGCAGFVAQILGLG